MKVSLTINDVHITVTEEPHDPVIEVTVGIDGLKTVEWYLSKTDNYIEFERTGGKLAHDAVEYLQHTLLAATRDAEDTLDTEDEEYSLDKLKDLTSNAVNAVIMKNVHKMLFR